MSDFWSITQPTYIENWPSRYCRLSIAQKGIRLDQDQTLRFGKNMMEWGEVFYPEDARPPLSPVPDITDIHDELDAAIKNLFPSGAFVRLGSRSPKDSWFGHQHGFRCESGQDALDRLLDGSERVYEDIALALNMGCNPYLWVREWQSIEPWQEFRCFMRNRKLVGISEYAYLDNPDPRIAVFADLIEYGIRKFFSSQFRPIRHLDSVVFDVFVKISVFSSQQRSIEVKLLEINPFFEWTDPCLFDWRDDGDFDGGFRYRAQTVDEDFDSGRLEQDERVVGKREKYAGRLGA